MNNIYNLLGIAMRANQVVTGDTAMEAIRNKKAKLVIIASDASENTKKKVQDKCAYYNISWIELEDSFQISYAIGKVNRMFIALLDDGFKNKVLSYQKDMEMR